MAIISGLTIDDFEKLPDALALNHELVDGELVDVSGNTGKHNRLRDRIVLLLLPFVEQHKMGLLVSEQEFEFGENAHGPDVSFIGSSKAGNFDDGLRVQRFVPDLAIEIVSRNDRFADLLKKVNRYLKYGTVEVWLFSIETREAYVYSGPHRAILDENEQFSTDLIPGFSIRIGELFDRIQ
jgi:Uma2 family endonuclease